MKNWYSITNKSDGVLDISLHEEIGMFGISAAEFVQELQAKENVRVINLSIHSPGGSVMDGLAIYNSLKSHPAKVFGRVLGIAASAASFVLMASDVITMPEDAFIMIHNAQGGVMGDAEDMREMADILETVQNTIINIYEKRTGADREAIADMMKVETWMTSVQALEFGFVDTVTDSMDVAAKINMFSKHFKNMPVQDISIDDIKNIKGYEKFLRDSGLSRGLATALTSRAKVIFQSESEEDLHPLNAVIEALDKVKLPV